MKTVELGGKYVPLLTVRDMMELAAYSFEIDRQHLLEDLEAAKVTGIERLDALREQSRIRGTSASIIRATLRIEGAQWIIRRSCMANGIDADAVLAGMTIDQITRKAANLAGYSFGEESDANPRTPSQPTA
jgi:hypothetical protein